MTRAIYYYQFNKMAQLSNECKTLIKRLKECDLEVVERNPTLMLQYYPIRNPDKEETIFDEVYCLLNETLLLKNYRFRVFLFLNTFLSSIKVPAYVIAAYMKRLSRMTLNAKPRSLVAILGIVENLIVSHPVLQVLRSRVDERAREMELVSGTCTIKSWLDSDPFDAKVVNDLKRTNAMDSCIWEMMPLRYHWHPKVRRAASFLK